MKTHEVTGKLYGTTHLRRSSTTANVATRDSFEQEKQVYVPHENTWYSPSQCVWAEPSVKIPGKASIADV